MNNDRISKVEKSIKLRKKIYEKNIWKNYALVPPSIVIFAGVLGISYLLNLDKLFSVYTIPFALIFVIGTIWLKSTKKYLLNQKIEKSSELKVCLTIPFTKFEKEEFILFSTGSNRNNKYFLEKEKKTILENKDYLSQKTDLKTSLIQYNDTDLYIARLPVKRKYSGQLNNEYWVIYKNDNSLNFFTTAELNKFS